MSDQVLMALRGQVIAIIMGSVFVFIGIAACAMAAVRGRGRVRMLMWLGVFNAMYGARILAQSAAFDELPRSVWPSRLYVIATITYLILIPALLFWMELSLGRLRRVIQITVIAAVVVGVAGVFGAIISRNPFSLALYNSILAIWCLLTLAVATAVPSLSKRYLAIQSPVSAVGTLLLAAAVLYSNFSVLFRYGRFYGWIEPLAFGVFVFSLGYVAARKIFADERRLLSIESELEVARQIQISILPSRAPELDSLRISTAYRPMTAVAGDFYEFIPIDEHRVGFLVADVSGHGVPAALIASMIKVAMQSVIACANEPGEVLRGLNRILTAQLRGQFVTAAYLWLDSENRQACYSAAGHPPLLCWRDGRLERIESNGLLFGVTANATYPIYKMDLKSGDRLLLYTDGVIEPENDAGESFGENKLEEVVRENRSRAPAELSNQLLSAVEHWQPASVSQQDDITLMVIDVV